MKLDARHKITRATEGKKKEEKNISINIDITIASGSTNID